MKPFEKAELYVSPDKRERLLQDLSRVFVMTREEVEKKLDDELKGEVWVNDVYQVVKKTVEDGIVWLSIKRLDKEPCRDWRDFQAIKNQLVGPECEGVELFPAESRLIDTSNQYHLWVHSDPHFRFDIGLNEGRHIVSESTRDSKQRPP